MTQTDTHTHACTHTYIHTYTNMCVCEPVNTQCSPTRPNTTPWQKHSASPTNHLTAPPPLLNTLSCAAAPTLFSSTQQASSQQVHAAHSCCAHACSEPTLHLRVPRTHAVDAHFQAPNGVGHGHRQGPALDQQVDDGVELVREVAGQGLARGRDVLLDHLRRGSWARREEHNREKG